MVVQPVCVQIHIVQVMSRAHAHVRALICIQLHLIGGHAFSQLFTADVSDFLPFSSYVAGCASGQMMSHVSPDNGCQVYLLIVQLATTDASAYCSLEELKCLCTPQKLAG